MRLGDRCQDCGGVIRCEQTRTSGAVRWRFLVCRSCGWRGKERVFLDERNRVIAGNTKVDCSFMVRCNDETELALVKLFLQELRKNGND